MTLCYLRKPAEGNPSLSRDPGGYQLVDELAVDCMNWVRGARYECEQPDILDSQQYNLIIKFSDKVIFFGQSFDFDFEDNKESMVMEEVRDESLLKKLALANFLECAFDDVEVENEDESIFKGEGCEYRVLTDDEADQAVRDYIRDTLWAFRPSFLKYYACIDSDSALAVFEALTQRYESSNEAIYELVKGRFDELVSDAICSDGRGHYIPMSYGYHEYEIGEFYIYRLS